MGACVHNLSTCVFRCVCVCMVGVYICACVCVHEPIQIGVCAPQEILCAHSHTISQ